LQQKGNKHEKKEGKYKKTEGVRLTQKGRGAGDEHEISEKGGVKKKKGGRNTQVFQTTTTKPIDDQKAKKNGVEPGKSGKMRLRKKKKSVVNTT